MIETVPAQSEMVRRCVGALKTLYQLEVDRIIAHFGTHATMDEIYVRVIIKAMREPTEAMTNIGYPHSKSAAKDAWEKMIDEALK